MFNHHAILLNIQILLCQASESRSLISSTLSSKALIRQFLTYVKIHYGTLKAFKFMKKRYGRGLKNYNSSRIYTLKDIQTLLYPIITSHKSLHYLKLPALAILSFLSYLDIHLVVWVKEVVGVTSCKLATLDLLLAFFGIHDSVFNSWELWQLDCEKLKFISDGNLSIAEQILLYWIGIQVL